MFTKHEFKLERFVAVCWSYGKLFRSIVGSTVTLVDYSMVKAWILVLPYKPTPSFVESFSGFKYGLVCRNLWYVTERTPPQIGWLINDSREIIKENFFLSSPYFISYPILFIYLFIKLSTDVLRFFESESCDNIKENK